MKKIGLIIYILYLTNIFGYAQQKPIVIVCFGNSTTAPRKGVNKVYATRLHEKLDSLKIVQTVFNAGVGSSHTGSAQDNNIEKVMHAMDRFDSAVLRHHPDWVTINFGLNDAYQDKGINTASRIPLKNFKKNIKYFIRKIKRQGGQVILLTPNPQTSTYESFRSERVKQYAIAIRKISHRKNTYLIDSWKLFYDWGKGRPNGIDGLFLDKIHPNDEGHRLIAEEICKIIKSHYKNK